MTTTPLTRSLQLRFATEAQAAAFDAHVRADAAQSTIDASALLAVEYAIAENVPMPDDGPDMPVGNAGVQIVGVVDDNGGWLL